MKFAPVMIVSGGVEYLRVRKVQEIVQAAIREGRRLVTVAAGDEESLHELLSGGFLFADATVALVESAIQKKKKTAKSKVEDTSGGWSEEAVALLQAHAKAGDASEVVFVVHHEGEATAGTCAGLVATCVPKNQHYIVPTPKPWEEKDFAVKFLLSEVRGRYKRTIADDLAEQVVRKVGTDVGLLSFEALKFSTLLDVDGRNEVTVQDVAALMAAFGSEDWETFKSALGNKNAKAVIRSWNDIRSGPGGETIAKALSILSSTLVQWTHAAALHEMKVAPEDAAARVGMHPYRYTNVVLPSAVRWGRRPLESLLKAVTKVGVRKGHVNPWVAVESTLVLACESR